jgi:hypothetical protein
MTGAAQVIETMLVGDEEQKVWSPCHLGTSPVLKSSVCD